ncbi:hypothetical protein ACFX11_035033 [Malus domestica]
MGSENRDFHICFFSLIAHSHMILISNMAKLLESQGVKTTTVTTPQNAPAFSKATQSSKTCSDGVEVKIKTIKFPSVEVGLPESCLVVDVFFPRATDVAAKFIQRLIFLGTSFFAMATLDNMRSYKPFNDTSSDLDPFVILDFPGEITMTRVAQVLDHAKENIENDLTQMLKRAKEAEKMSYGIVVNSFYELKSVYANCYRNVLGMKAWHIGPVSMCNRNNEEKAVREKQLLSRSTSS